MIVTKSPLRVEPKSGPSLKFFQEAVGKTLPRLGIRKEIHRTAHEAGHIIAARTMSAGKRIDRLTRCVFRRPFWLRAPCLLGGLPSDDRLRFGFVHQILLFPLRAHQHFVSISISGLRRRTMAPSRREERLVYRPHVVQRHSVRPLEREHRVPCLPALRLDVSKKHGGH